MGKSSKDKRDVYYRLAKEDGYRARSAYKLLQIYQDFDIFDGVRNAVDLCAAPGSWSQVLQKILSSQNDQYKIVAVDLQTMAPIEGVTQLQGDITSTDTAQLIVDQFEGARADLVICDGAPDVTGLHDFDEYIQGQLVAAAVRITTHLLIAGGTFVAKIFRGSESHFLVSQMRTLFRSVSIAKPKSSRVSSVEAFIVCQGYFKEPDFKLPLTYSSAGNHLSAGDPNSIDREGLDFYTNVDYIECGSLYPFDSDTNYSLDIEKFTGTKYSFREPVQSPINPPYKEVCEMKSTRKNI